MENDFEKELLRILSERDKEIEAENNLLLESARKDFSMVFQEKTKEDFLNQNKKEKELKKRHKTKKIIKMLFFILLVIIGLIFIYYKFIRNNEVEIIEFTLITMPSSEIVADITSGGICNSIE